VSQEALAVARKRRVIEDVGALAAFLASPEARYITGSVFTIDGGRSLGDLG
jgi:NAD(P)-dependent dehydrogenase (short-subunit alcohol dehydrogenase family)